MNLEKIRQLCKERDTTITELEKAVGMGNGAIGKWRTSSPTVKNLKAVADYLGVSVDYLLTAEEEENNDPGRDR